MRKTENINLTKKHRIWELDMLRGFAIIMVFFDHLFYDFAIIFDSWKSASSEMLNSLHFFGIDYVYGDLRSFWRPAFLFLFIFTSGLCTAFSRNNYLRSIKLAFVAITVSVVTYYISYSGIDVFILFGVLHCLAIIILIYALTESLIKLILFFVNKAINIKNPKKLYKIILSATCLIFSGVFLFINEKYNVGFYDATTNFETITSKSRFLGLFFFSDYWWSADYFPLFPYISFFFLGAGLTNILYPSKKSLLPFLDTVWHKPFSIPGHYSIIFYLGGQFIALSICLILTFALGAQITI